MITPEMRERFPATTTDLTWPETLRWWADLIELGAEAGDVEVNSRAYPGRWATAVNFPDRHGPLPTSQYRLRPAGGPAWHSWAVDTRVIVAQRNGMRVRQHFAGVAPDGRPMTFQFGKTSWTSAGPGRDHWDMIWDDEGRSDEHGDASWPDRTP